MLRVTSTATNGPLDVTLTGTGGAPGTGTPGPDGEKGDKGDAGRGWRYRGDGRDRSQRRQWASGPCRPGGSCRSRRC